MYAFFFVADNQKSTIFASCFYYISTTYLDIMDNNFKIKIDNLVDEINTVTDLVRKIEILNYMEQQASYMLWQLEEEKRIDDDSRDY